MSVSVIASRCKERNSSSVRTRPTCFSTNLSVESRRDSSQPGTMAMSWSDRASSPNNRTFPDSVQATAAEEEAHKHGPFYRNPGKTGDKQSSQPPLHAQNTGSHHVPYRPISDKHFPPKPLSTRRQKKGTAQNTPRRTMTNSLETSLKPEPNIIAILVAAIGIIPPASSIVRKKGAGNEEMLSDKPPRLLSRGVSIQTDFGLKSKILKIQPSKSRRIPYDQSKRPAPYCISTISEL